MGEAKRKRAAGSVKSDNYDTGFTLSEFLDGYAKHQGKVKCGSCTNCCYIEKLDLLPHETGEGLDTEIKDGVRLLKHRPDGGCIHLGPEGCTVYENRPLACRKFDCRIFATVGIRMDADHTGQHVTPPWTFRLKARKDKIVYVALRLGQLELMRDNPSATAELSLQYSFANLERLSRSAAEFVDYTERLPPDEKRKLVEMLEKGTATAG